MYHNAIELLQQADDKVRQETEARLKSAMDECIKLKDHPYWDQVIKRLHDREAAEFNSNMLGIIKSVTDNLWR